MLYTESMFGLVVLVVAFIGIILLSLFTLLKNPKSATNRLLFMFSLTLAAYSVVNYLALHQSTDIQTFFWVKWLMSIVPLLNLFYFLIVETFPRPNLSIKPVLLIFSILFSVLLIPIAQANLIFSNVQSNGENFISTPGAGMPLFLFHTIFFLGGGLFLLIKRYRGSQGVEKVQLRFLLMGTLLMYALTVSTNLLFVLFFNITTFIGLLPLYICILVGFISYAILRHRFLDITALVARTVSYTIAIVVAVSGYVLLLFAVAALIPGLTATPRQLIAFTTIGLVLFFTSGTLRGLIEKVTDKIFFKGRYDPEELLSSLTHIMAEELDIRILSKRLLSALNEQMRIVNSAFIVIDKNRNQVEIEEDHGKSHYTLTNDELEKLMFWGKSVVFEELQEGEEKAILRKHEISIFVTLKTKEDKVGFLLLGPKASGDIYNSSDIEVLEIFGNQAAVALQNALSYLEIQEFSRTLEKKVVERTHELKETQERELAKANELLRIKDEFVFIATHDLKTPVTAIDGYISLIKEDKPKWSSDIEENFEAVQEASDRLKQLVNDLLEVARGESGTIKVNVSPLDIREVVKRVVREVKPAADEKKVELKEDIDGSATMVMADADKLYEVIENLMSNAIKFSKPEGAYIGINTKKNGDILEVSVADNGFGIPKAEQTKVFQKFFKYRGDNTLDVPGTGLGLFVVRMLIEKMGGKISFSSEEGKGTTFTFTLPLAK